MHVDLPFRSRLPTTNRNLLSRVHPVDYLDDAGVSYRRTHGSSGPQLNVKSCPCCGNNSYKVFLNANTGLGNCFSGGCQMKFNIYSFIKALHGFTSHADVLAEATRHVTAYRHVPQRETRADKKGPPPVLYLPESVPIPFKGKNLNYLSERDIPSSVAEKYGLRFCRQGTFEYHNEDGQKQSQNYSNRVIIPIYDIGGKLVSFQGRDTTGDANRKYLFPSGFSATGSNLYGANLSHGKAEVVICEGIFDVIAAQIALPEVGCVGSFGINITQRFGDDEDQITQLKRLEVMGMERVTIMWDGEIGAMMNACENGLSLIKKGFEVYVCMLPSGSDPNDLSVEDVRKCFEDRVRLTRLSAVSIMAKANGLYVLTEGPQK